MGIKAALKKLTFLYATNRGNNGCITTVAAWLAVIALIVTAVVLWLKSGDEDVVKWCLGFWTMAPPIWFWAEYHWFRDPTLPNVDEFIHSQECSRNIWLALVGLLVAFYYSEFTLKAKAGTSETAIHETAKGANTGTGAGG